MDIKLIEYVNFIRGINVYDIIYLNVIYITT